MSGHRTAADESVLTRGPELAVALLLIVIGLMIVTDSARIGAGWADDGPQSGYFPFYVGCALLGSAAWVALRQVMQWRRDASAFAERSQIVQVVSVLVPMVVYVALIFPLGIYVASALMIGFFMVVFGKYRALPTAAVALGVPLVFFLVFERWFLVPLPKGTLERLLGF